MYFTKLLLLLFATTILGKVVPPKSKSYACQAPPPHNYTSDCFVDLTVAIDMSIAMKSDANIATLVDSLLTTLMPSLNFKETYTAGLAYGALSIGASNYFNNYADICQYVHSAQEQAIQLGIGKANLSEVFETYQITLLNSGRNYKKVLVLLTSINDAKEIEAAKHYSVQLQASGVVIIVGALGNASVPLLSQLGNYVIEASDFTLPATKITGDICQFGGITVPTVLATGHVSKTSPLPLSTAEAPSTTTKSPTSKLPPPPPPPTTTKLPPPPPPTTTKLPPPPPSTTPPKPPTTPSTNNQPGIGTNCSTNVKNAWLDIALVFDVSNAITNQQLDDLIKQTLSYIETFTLNQNGQHTTRVAIISYASNPTIVYSLNGNQSFETFTAALWSLANRTKPYDNIVNIQHALQVAFDHLQDYGSYRPQIILLTAAAYQHKGFTGADHTADQIKEDEITIFTVNFNEGSGVLTQHLEPLASPGYAYNSTDSGLKKDLPLALTQVNCFCPGSTQQFKVFDAVSKRFTKYADCLSGYAGETSPSIVTEFGCNSGILAAITSQEKLDFVVDKVLDHELIGKKAFTVGGHKVGNKWVWSGYNGTFEFGSFPPFTEVSPTDEYTFFDPQPGPTLTFKSTGDVARPYLCQSRACDADFICDQSIDKKRFIKKY